MLLAYRSTPAAVPAATLGLAALALAVSHPRLTLYAALLAIPLEVTPLAVGPLSASESLLVLTSLGWVTRSLISGSFPFRASSAGVALGIFGWITIISVFLGSDPGTSAKVGVMTLVLVVLFHFVTKDGDSALVVGLLCCLVVSAAIVSAFAILNNDQSSITYIGTDAFYREAGVFAHSNTFATFVAMALPASIVLAFVGPRSTRIVAAIAAGLILIGLILTLSRGGILAAGASLTVMLIWAPMRRSVAVMLACLALLAGTGVSLSGHVTYIDNVTKRIGTLASAAEGNDPRVAIWRGAIEMIEDRPLTGVGPGAFEQAGPAYGLLNPLATEFPFGVPSHAHNLLLNIAAERGIPAMLSFVLFLLAIGKDCVRAILQAAGVQQTLAIAVSAGLTAFVVQGFVDYTFSTNVIGATVIMLAGCSVLLADPTSDQEAR